MTTFGYFLSTEQYGPAALLDQARRAEDAGFEALWISDHYHPWTEAQGQSPFVWSVIGALSQVTSLPVTTSVTCPTLRIHPAVIAQAAATSAVMHEGRFVLGIGSGENLNEHVLGQRWPVTDVRLQMLEESVEVMRALFTGEEVTHHGTHYTVEDAKLYTVPDEPVKIYVSAFGPKAGELAGRIGDGFCTVGPQTGPKEAFEAAGGAGKPTQTGTKVAWGDDAEEMVELVHRLWPNEALPGEMLQELRVPAHFEQASQLVTKDMIRESKVCGDDVDAHVSEVRSLVDAGFSEVFVNQIGPDLDGFFAAYRDEVLPQARG